MARHRGQKLMIDSKAGSMLSFEGEPGPVNTDMNQRTVHLPTL